MPTATGPPGCGHTTFGPDHRTRAIIPELKNGRYSSQLIDMWMIEAGLDLMRKMQF